MLNAGAWLYEPLLVDRASAPHPYWPGGAVLLEDGEPTLEAEFVGTQQVAVA